MSERLEQFRDEMASALETAAREAVGEVLQAVTAVDDAGTQSQILLALLEGSSRFASRAAFFLTQMPSEIRGWASRGFGQSAPAIEGAEFDFGDGPWPELARGGGAVLLSGDECTELCGRLGADPGSEGVLIPFVLRGQLGGALYADRLPGADRLKIASLQLVTHAAAQALETVAFRGGASPALRSSGEAAPPATGIPLWRSPEAASEVEPSARPAAPAAPPVGPPAEEIAEPLPEEPEIVVEAEPEFEPAVGEEVAPEPEEEAGEPVETAADLGFETEEGAELEPGLDEMVEEPEPELEDTSVDIWALEEEEEEEEEEEPTQVGAVPEPAVEEPPPAEIVGQETVRLDISRLKGQVPVAPPAELGFRPPEPEEYEPEPAVAPEEYEPEPGPEEPADLGEEPTVISAGPPVEYRPAEPVAEPRREAAGSTEVQPPIGLEGPGSAFVKTPPEEIAEGEDALHEEARRLARLLVSEIKLYNEEIIEEGRRNADIYDRLKDDIDRSRQMYEERIDPRLHGKENYFHQELVQRLAGGDESLLGM